jgi:hypothetical protein
MRIVFFVAATAVPNGILRSEPVAGLTYSRRAQSIHGSDKCDSRGDGCATNAQHCQDLVMCFVSVCSRCAALTLKRAECAPRGTASCGARGECQLSRSSALAAPSCWAMGGRLI